MFTLNLATFLSPCGFIARITHHIPDESFQLVRSYYRCYSNKMRG